MYIRSCCLIINSNLHNKNNNNIQRQGRQYNRFILAVAVMGMVSSKKKNIFAQNFFFYKHEMLRNISDFLTK